MSSSCDLRVAVLALGTRGDVQPLAVLAAALQQHTGAATTLVTHEQHRVWLEDLLPQLHVVGCGMLPAAVWGAQQQQQSHTAAEQLERQLELCKLCCSALAVPLPGTDSAGVQRAGHQAKASQQKQQTNSLLFFNLFALEAYHLAEALGSACAAAHPYVIPYSMPAAFEQQFQQQEPVLYQQLQGAVGNREGLVSWSEVRHWMWPLFTERWQLLRERLGLDPWPQLHQADQQQQDREPQEQEEQQRLQAQQPQVQTRGSEGVASWHTPLCHAWPLLYGCSQVVLPRPGHWPSSVHITGYWYLHHLHQTGGDHASTSTAAATSNNNSKCGGTAAGSILPEELEAWLQQAAAGDGVHASAGAAYGRAFMTSGSSPVAAAAAAAAAADSPPGPTTAATAHKQQQPSRCKGVVCVDFGSMGQLGLLPDPQHLLATLTGALQQLGWRAVLLSGGWAALEAAYGTWAAAPDNTSTGVPASAPLDVQEGQQHHPQHQALPASDGVTPDKSSVLLLWRHPLVHHQQLLGRCSVLWTHGGSGTVAGALAAATPMVVTPLQFDQHFWAERVAYLGAGLVLPGNALWSAPGTGPPSTDAGAAAQLLAATLLQAADLDCHELAEAVVAEDGVQRALSLLSPMLA